MSQIQTISNNAIVTEDDLKKILTDSKFKGFTEKDIAYAARICNELRLSPFLNQIHFTKRKSNNDSTYAIVVQTGIDGLRLQAQRTGAYAGSDKPKFSTLDSNKNRPVMAEVTVYRIVQGVRCAFIGEARWDEFYPKAGNYTGMWDSMPFNQLAKCAEAQALRKAFPAELSSIYADDEMHQADDSPSKADRLNKQLNPVQETKPATETIDGELVDEPTEPPEPEEPAVLKCSLCDKEMMLSRAGTSYYCPNFGDKSKGEHPRVPV